MPYRVDRVELRAPLISEGRADFSELKKSSLIPQAIVITAVKKAEFADHIVYTTAGGYIARKIQNLNVYLIQFQNTEGPILLTCTRILYDMTSLLGSVGYSPRTTVEFWADENQLLVMGAPGGGPFTGVTYPSPAAPQLIPREHNDVMANAVECRFVMPADIVGT